MTTFTRITRVSDPETDTATKSTSTIEGVAVRVRGEPQRYSELGLVESEAPTLFFVPATYGDTPKAGDRTTWMGETFTVRDVNPVAPDGVTICARVIVSK